MGDRAMTSQSSVWRIGAFILATLALGAALACAPLNALFGGQQRDSGVTLVTERNTQYMTGEAVGGAGCLIFPASVDLETTFLLPGDFVPATALNRFRQSEGQAEVAGRGGTRYTFEADEVEGFTDVSGEMVADGGLVLSYDFSGHTLETPFKIGR